MNMETETRSSAFTAILPCLPQDPILQAQEGGEPPAAGRGRQAPPLELQGGGRMMGGQAGSGQEPHHRQPPASAVPGAEAAGDTPAGCLPLPAPLSPT